MGRAVDAGRAKVTLSVDGEKALRDLENRLDRIGQGFQRTGLKAVASGGAILAAFAPAVRIFASFDDQMRQVQAVTGATTAEFAQLSDEAKRLGATTSFSASQVAGMMAELGRAGFDPTQIMQASEQVLALSAATSTELPRAAEIAGAALRGFNLDASEMGRVADVLSATANGTAQTLDDLFEALKPVAPIAAAAGESIEDTSALIGVLANNGIKGSLAGNALARAFKNLANDKTQKKLEGMGVSAVDAEGNLRPLIDIIADLDKATAGFGEAKRLATFETLFGRGQAAALKLAEATRGGFEEVAEGIRNSSGAATETAAQMESGIGGTFRRLWSSVEGVAIAVGESLAPAMTEAANRAMAILGPLTQWIAANGEIVTGVALAAAGLVAGGAAAIAVGAVLSGLATIIGTVTAVSTALAGVWGAVAAAAGVVSAPVLAIVAAVGLAIEIIGRLLGFESPIGSLFGVLGDGAVWAAERLRGVLGGTLGWLIDRVKEFVRWLGIAGDETVGVGDAAGAAAITAPPAFSPEVAATAQRAAVNGVETARRAVLAGGGGLSLASFEAALRPLLEKQGEILEAAQETAANTARIANRRGLTLGR